MPHTAHQHPLIVSLRGGVSRRSNLFVNLTPAFVKEQNNILTRSTGGASAEAPEDTARRGAKPLRHKGHKIQFKIKCQPHQKSVIPGECNETRNPGE
jgi:hypothetical protein